MLTPLWTLMLSHYAKTVIICTTQAITFGDVAMPEPWCYSIMQPMTFMPLQCAINHPKWAHHSNNKSRWCCPTAPKQSQSVPHEQLLLAVLSCQTHGIEASLKQLHGCRIKQHWLQLLVRINQIFTLFQRRGGSWLSCCDIFLNNQSLYPERIANYWRSSGEVAWQFYLQNKFWRMENGRWWPTQTYFYFYKFNYQ